MAIISLNKRAVIEDKSIKITTGEVAAGIQGVCTLESCNLTDEDYNRNFGHSGTLVGGNRNFRKVAAYFDESKDAEKAKQFKENPFDFAEFHTYYFYTSTSTYNCNSIYLYLMQLRI